jgi:hypothetical protein
MPLTSAENEKSVFTIIAPAGVHKMQLFRAAIVLE